MIGRTICAAVACVLLCSLATGCKKDEPTEEERFQKLQEGIKVKGYRAVSKRALPRALSAYNKKRPEGAPEVQPIHVRALLGFTLALLHKPKLAIVEAQLITASEGSPAPHRALGHVLLSLVMQEQGLTRLARVETDRGVELLGKEYEKETKIFLSVTYLLFGVNAIKSRDFKMARMFFGGLKTITGVAWPHALVDVMADVEDKKLQTALVKAKKLSTDEQMPAELRKVLADLVKKMEAKSGPVESKLFWPRLTSKLLLEEVGKSKHLEPVSDLVNKVKNKLPSL